MDISLRFNELDGSLDSLAQELADVPGVQQIVVGSPAMPIAGTKGAQPASDLSLKLIPSALAAVLKAATVAFRKLTATPTEVSISRSEGTLKVIYDPRYETSDEICTLMASLLEADAKFERRPI